MGVYKRSSKTRGTRWYGKVNVTIDGEYVQQKTPTFDTKAEAKQAEATLLAAILSRSEPVYALTGRNALRASKTPVGASKSLRTFQDVFDEYWGTVTAKGLGEGTKETKINMLTKHILPYFGTYAMTDITPEVVQQWQEQMKQKERRGERFKETYLHSVQSQLNCVLNYAVRKTYISYSPMVDLKNMGSKNAKPRDFWTIEEFSKFSEYAKTKEKTYLFFVICYFLGLRRGECLGIRPMDISYDSRIGSYVVHIETSVSAKGRIGDTKNKPSDRVIAIPDTIKMQLDEYMEHQYDLKPSDRIFRNLTVSHINRDKKWAIEQAGIQYICIHGMRHSAASNLLSTGVASGKMTTQDVAKILGHSSQLTTVRTYAHILPQTQATAADLIDALHSKI